MEGTPPLMVR